MNQAEIDQLIEDLRGFATAALDELQSSGKAHLRRTKRVSQAQPLTLMGVVNTAEQFMALLPRLLDDAREEAVLVNSRMEQARTPRRATWPRSPGGFDRHDDRLYPRFWTRASAQLHAREDVLRWLLGQLTLVAATLERHAVGAADYVSQLEQVTEHVDQWSTRDMQRARAYGERISHARGALRRGVVTLHKEAGKRLVASVQRPDPFPQSPAWKRLAHLMSLWKAPKKASRTYINRALASPTELEDLPFLYQRWCGVQLLQVLKIKGWTPTRPAVWPVLMGGRCELAPPFASKKQIILWFEPHIGRKDHACGLHVTARTQQSASPDIVIQFYSPDGLQTVVLDPTLTTSREQLEGKGRYLRVLESSDDRMVAGVPVGRKTPLRSWAISPVNRTSCDVIRRDGTVGVVPLSPGHPRQALQAFVDDVLRWTR